MKKLLLALIPLCLLLAACGNVAREEKQMDVVTTLFPAYDFARNIAGERLTVELIVPPGSDIHSFEPSARDLAAMQTALVICNGGESEHWVEEILHSAGGPEPLRMMDCVEVVEEELKEGMEAIPHSHGGESCTEDHGHGEKGEYDEHVWTSPRNAVAICEEICERFCRLDPEGESVYRENLAAYREKLLALDGEFRRVTGEAPLNTLVFADRFPVRYFVEEYGLDYFAAYPGCNSQAEPSARTVAFLIDKVRELGSPAVLYIEFSNEKMADILCEDTGCKKLPFHSCHNVSAQQFQQGVGYLELMEGNLESLKEALGWQS